MTRNERARLQRSTAPKWRIAIGRAIGILGAVWVAYMIAGLVGGAIPANRDWVEPEQGIAVWVEDNGIHTGIVLPLVGPADVAGADWRDLISPYDARDPAYGRHSHVAFGWGDRDFYVNTPRWRGLRPMTVVNAAIGSEDTVMYVERIAEPRPASHVRRVVLRPAEYARLVAFIRDSFEVGSSGIAAAQPGYANHDSFYTARGRYTAFNTCNSWTGRALRTAGVRLGLWTPFSVTVMTWL